MFTGMVVLAAGILSGAVSTSARAKATTLVIFGIAGSVGAYAISLNTVITSLPRFVGVLIIIIIPSVVIAFASMKSQKYFRPIAVIFLAAMAVGAGSFTAFGFIGPGAQFSLHPLNETNATQVVSQTLPTAPVISVSIPVNASIKGNPNFTPNTVTVPKGDIIRWTNNDTVPHTVTNAPDGSIFDSSLIAPGKTYSLDTSKLNGTEYDYMCTVHPFMTGKIVIIQPLVANVTISKGASTQSAGQKYFDPASLSVKVGTTVTWTNQDAASHTVTSGDPSAGPSGTFDSSLIKPGDTFKHAFTTAGTTSYFCTVHPWMTGKVIVG